MSNHSRRSKKRICLAPSSYFSLGDLPLELIQEIFLFSHSETRNALPLVCRSFSFLPCQESLVLRIFRPHILSDPIPNARLTDSYYHESIVLGFLLNNYNHYIMDKLYTLSSSGRPEIAELKDLVTSEWLSSSTKTRFGKQDWLSYQERQSRELKAPGERREQTIGSTLMAPIYEDYAIGDLTEAKLSSFFEEIGVYSSTRCAIFSDEVVLQSSAMWATAPFQMFARLLPHNLGSGCNFPLVTVFDHLGLFRERVLNPCEENLLEVFCRRGEITESPKREVVVGRRSVCDSLEVFLARFESIFHLSAWKEVFPWESFFLVGGSVLRCVERQEVFERSGQLYGEQDLDFFFVSEDYYQFQNAIETFREDMVALGHAAVHETERGRDMYVRGVEVTFSDGKMQLFQFIWYDDNMTHEDILHIFDIDICMVGFDSKRVLCTHPFVQAMNTKTFCNYKLINNIDHIRNYKKRTLKYLGRGFQLVVPKEFDQELLMANERDGATENFRSLKPTRSVYTGFLLNNDSFFMCAKFVRFLKERMGIKPE